MYALQSPVGRRGLISNRPGLETPGRGECRRGGQAHPVPSPVWRTPSPAFRLPAITYGSKGGRFQKRWSGQDGFERHRPDLAWPLSGTRLCAESQVSKGSIRQADDQRTMRGRTVQRTRAQGLSRPGELLRRKDKLIRAAGAKRLRIADRASTACVSFEKKGVAFITMPTRPSVPSARSTATDKKA